MNIAILGYGVVGGGVHELLRDGRLGIHVRKVLDIRPLADLGGLVTDNIGDILGDPAIDCVVETMGGMHPALSYVTSSLRTGKHVVTSNKELISHAMAPLAEGAGMHGVQIRFSSSVGGGIPWIDNVARQRRSDTLTQVRGIVNGTTNYILAAMERGMDFAAALAQAQDKGYAELDASADLDGIDTQRKCAISASLAFETIVEPDHIPALGIRNIRGGDVQAFAAQGLVCKLMMKARQMPDGVCAYVEPTLLAVSDMAAHVPSNHNYIALTGETVGDLGFFGQGAGRYPTAQNVVQDLLDIAARTKYPPRGIQPLPVVNQGERHAYYVRTQRPEMLAGYDVRPMGPGVLTEPVDVDVLHTLAGNILEADAEAFFAGVEA